MKPDKGHLYDLSLPLQNQLNLTARVALAISVIASLALLLTLYFLFRGQQDNYLQIIQSLTRSHDQLVMAMLIGGAIIILMAGLVTGFIMLYSSARIAGPLYRFSRNIEMEINEGPVQPIELRKGDYLQELSTKLAGAAQGLQDHYAEQQSIVCELEHHLHDASVRDADAYDDLLNRLNRIVSRKPS